MQLISLAVLVVASHACAAPSATTIPPGHGSAENEARAAWEHDRAAGVMERQAGSEVAPTECGFIVAGGGAQICWTQPRIPGAVSWDLAAAARQREAAQEHRRVSQALRDAEALTCAGLSEADMTRSPFAHTADIVDVQLIQGPAGVAGASVRFHQLEKLSGDWLQHVINCHLARDNALGHDVPEMSYCPLVPRGASATVTDIPHGYVVEVTSADPDAAREIARRAMALKP